jgi:hypothetical protein
MSSIVSPVVIGTPMKSGTWLIRKILSDITGLAWHEPPMIKPMDASSASNLILRSDSMYSWHFVPDTEIVQKLQLTKPHTFFVVRNIFSMVLSMYHHFADNIDWEIGRGANQTQLFHSLTKEQGIRRIIIQDKPDSFHWDGIGRHFYQMQKMLEYSLNYQALLLTYEELTQDKTQAIKRIIKHLGISLDDNDIQNIVTNTNFNQMKQDSLTNNTTSHFRKGLIHEYQNIISETNKQLILEQLTIHAPLLGEYCHQLNIPYLLTWENQF